VEVNEMSPREIYENSIRQLPAMDRLRLASLILDDLAASDGTELDIREDWSEEDAADLIAFSLKHAGNSEPSEDPG
jgi:hypothetical protein